MYGVKGTLLSLSFFLSVCSGDCLASCRSVWKLRRMSPASASLHSILLCDQEYLTPPPSTHPPPAPLPPPHCDKRYTEHLAESLDNTTWQSMHKTNKIKHSNSLNPFPCQLASKSKCGGEMLIWLYYLYQGVMYRHSVLHDHHWTMECNLSYTLGSISWCLWFIYTYSKSESIFPTGSWRLSWVLKPNSECCINRKMS